jgi:hypothetical protein
MPRAASYNFGDNTKGEAAPSSAIPLFILPRQSFLLQTSVQQLTATLGAGNLHGGVAVFDI